MCEAIEAGGGRGCGRDDVVEGACGGGEEGACERGKGWGVHDVEGAGEADNGGGVGLEGEGRA